MTKYSSTAEWWATVASDEQKLKAWVRKLSRTEREGYEEHVAFINKLHLTERQNRILFYIAEDELRHAKYLDKLIDEMGWQGPQPIPRSSYWDYVLKPHMAYNEYCAANCLGEELAQEKFEVIRSHVLTPSYIKEFIDFALPDEIFHATTLRREAGEEALVYAEYVHREALGNY